MTVSYFDLKQTWKFWDQDISKQTARMHEVLKLAYVYHLYKKTSARIAHTDKPNQTKQLIYCPIIVLYCMWLDLELFLKLLKTIDQLITFFSILHSSISPLEIVRIWIRISNTLWFFHPFFFLSHISKRQNCRSTV